MISGLDQQVLVELLIILVAISVGSFIKGATGSGLPMIVIPVMAVFLGVERAVVIMAIPGIVINASLIWVHRRHFRATRDLPTLVGVGIVGAVIGTIGLDRLDPAVLALVMAAAIWLYIAVFLSRVEVQLTPKVTRVTSPVVGLGSGMLFGATGIAGPVMATYMHSLRLPRPVFVLSVSVLFEVYATVQALTLLRLGLYTPMRVVEGMVAVVPMLIVVPIAARTAAKLSQRAFELLVLVVIGATSIKLAYDGITGLTG